jgi:1-acyl-sn-glycerol-3-phosphate acyltransferase
VLHARLRLLSLWISQVARILADNCLRLALVLTAAQAGYDAAESAWELAAAIFVLPALVLAPLNGAISNGWPKRRVLVGAALFCLITTAVCAVVEGGWLWGFGLSALGNALYSPTRYALLPAAASDTHLPLARVNGWIEMGAVSAIIGGMLLGLRLFQQGGMQAAGAAIVALNAAAFLLALPVGFASDLCRPEAPWPAIRGFCRDFGRVMSDRETRSCLLALAALRGLVLAATGPGFAVLLGNGELEELMLLSLWILGGAAIGSLLAGVQGHPTRILGLVPFGTTGFCLALILGAIFQTLPWWLCALLGFTSGLVNVPLMATYQAGLPSDARGNGMAALNMAGYACMSVLALVMAGLASAHWLTSAGRLWLIVALAACGVAVAWFSLLRDAYEQMVELFFCPIYRVYGHGPGMETIPRRGPLLVLANHTAWFDPVWLGKVLPRRLTGMLTSVFFDLPVLHFLATRVVPTIRVESSQYRREAPELRQAIAALDRGEAVLIFPEGQMRKRDERPLHNFGRGVWHLLHERPQTPVVVCWIEGGWGSFASYRGGPPTRNKPFDFWRRIDVAMCEPEQLPPALLADQRATRNHLMDKCLNARRFLGLEPLQAAALVHSEPADE